jgi:DTW domain-containing protein YfiP
MELKRGRANTGRLAHLSLPGSEILVGINFDQEPRLQQILAGDVPVVLVYPAAQALDLSTWPCTSPLPWGQVPWVILIDATWAHAKKIYRLSTCLHQLPAVRFSPSQPSRYLIKQQPASYCLSTIETCYEIIQHFKQHGLERDINPNPLLSLFDAMQAIQIECMEHPPGPSHRI